MDKLIINIFFFLFLIMGAILDIQKGIIPHKIDVGIIFLGIVKLFFYSGNLEEQIIGMGIYPIIFLLIYAYGEDIFKKELVGFGDIKFLWSIGFYIGYTGLYDLLVFYNILFVVSGIYGIIGKYYYKKEILPFAPGICISTIIYFLMRGHI